MQITLQFVPLVTGGETARLVQPQQADIGHGNTGEGRRILLMAPLHHHFEKAGWDESKVVVRFWILGVLFALLAFSTLKVR